MCEIGAAAAAVERVAYGGGHSRAGACRCPRCSIAGFKRSATRERASRIRGQAATAFQLQLNFVGGGVREDRHRVLEDHVPETDT